MISRQNLLLAILLLFSTSLFAQVETAKLVSPNASPEAKALLQLIYNLSGKYTLTGQHNFPAAKDRNSRFAAEYSGRAPIIWSDDMGFAKEGDKDSYLKRADMVKEAIRQNQMGAIVTLCWHAVPPTASEPVTFQPLPGADPNALASVQGRLTDQQFKDILTPGTALNKKWMAQVDTVAHYLKELQKAHVPVLWRPYHEMNGSWFWWGGIAGQYSTQALYRQIFERLINYHKLNNLVWVWSVDRPTKPGMEFTNFYPGNKYLDIVALDVYGSDFKQDYYDQLLTLAKGKPITLGEVGSPPSPEVLDKQPKWSYWIIWSGMVRNTSKKQYEALLNDKRLLGLDDPEYITAVNPFRKANGLPVLSLNKPANFSGEWILNEEKSTLDNNGAGNLASKLKISQDGNELQIQRSYVEEWQDDRVTEEKVTLDGAESKSEFMNSPRITTAKLSDNGNKLLVNSKVTFNFGGQTSQMTTNEEWSLQNKGKQLSITQSSKSPRGERKITMVYEKQ
ncbi:MAG TPA: glycosyl hydrolase [Mucilaginibacter sp.]|nr:glycosyl hydrolase [Mucilaginibacter sp.]